MCSATRLTLHTHEALIAVPLPEEGTMTRILTPRAAIASLALLVSFATFAASTPPLPVAKPESVGMSSERLARIGPALKKEVADGSFRGAVVMVARKGKLVYHEAV